MKRFIHLLFVVFLVLFTHYNAYTQTVRIEIRAAGGMQEVNSQADCNLGPTGYSNSCTCCGRGGNDTDCSDCTGGGGVDVDVQTRFAVNGAWGSVYVISNDNVSCGINWWFNSANSIYSANVTVTHAISVQLGGREDDSGLCSPDDGDCYSTYSPSSGTNGYAVNSICASNGWSGDYYSNVENCSSDGSTNDYRVRWNYRYYFVSGYGAGNVDQSNVTACQGYDPPTLTSSSFTACYSQRNWQLNGVDISGATGATYNPGVLNTSGTYTYSTRYRYMTSFTPTYTDVYSGGRVYTIVDDPTASATKSPNVATVCEGQTLTLTGQSGTGGTGTCNYEYRHSTNNGGAWTGWSTTVSSFAAVTGTNLIEIRRNCNGANCDAPATQYSWAVVADPVAPSITKSPNVATVCEGQTLTAGTSGGTGGTGTCNNEYRYSTNNGVGWSGWSTTVPSFAAVTSATNRIQSRRDCSGSGCNSNIPEITWVVVADPVAPSMTKSPNVTTVCEDQTLTITPSGGTGGTGTCNNEYRYSTNNGGAWSSWSTSVPSFAAVTGTNLVESRRNCAGDGCDSDVKSVDWTVIDDPIAPVIAKDPSSATVCEGQTLTISVTTAGSGGTGTCNDEYRYSTNNGGAWSSWNTSIPSFAAVTSATNRVQSRRNCSGDGCNSNTNEVTWVVIADPVAPTMTKSPNVATVCEDQMLTVTPAGGTGGTGTCNNEYRYSTNNGGAWSSWSTSVPNFAAVTSATNRIQSRRDCNGDGCNSNTNEVTWVVVADPIAPTMTKSPNVATVCEGQTITVTPAGGTGGTGTCNNEYRYSTNNGGAWSSWSTSVPSFAAVISATNRVQSRRDCNGDGCNSNTNEVTWVVIDDPIAPTMVKSPTDATVCEGQTLTVTPTAGSGGTGTCNDEYRYSTNNGGAWTSWSVTVPNFAAVTSATNRIQSRRNCSGDGCNSNTNEVTWLVEADPVAPTMTKSPNVATVCDGQTLTMTPAGGTGGTGTCNNEYRYSTNNGGAWSSWSTTVPSFTAVTGTNLIESRRDCSGSGCNSNVNSISWTVVDDPVAPAITRNPTDATACVGASVNVTSVPGSGGTGTCTDEYSYSTNNGGSWSAWSVSIASFNTVLGTNIYRSRRVCNGSNCDESSYNSVSWTVLADPIAQTITKSPNVAAVCAGNNVSATFSAGSGGAGTVTDEYEYSTDAGFSWNAYTPGDPIATNALSGTNVVQVRTRRTATGPGCDATSYTTVVWTVNTPNTAATTTNFTPSTPICSGQNITLTTNAVAGFGATIEWYTATSGGGTNVGSSSSAVYAPTQDYTYYAYVSGGACPTVESNTGSHNVLNADDNVALYTGSPLGLVEQCVISGWTYYAYSTSPNDWLFAVRKNGNTVTFQIDLYTHSSVISTLRSTYPQSGSYLMKKYWNMKVATGSMPNPIDIKFYYDPSDLDDARDLRNTEAAPYLGGIIKNGAHPQWFKTNALPINGINGFGPSLITSSYGNQWLFAYDLLTPSTISTDNGVTYAQFDGLASLSGGTGGTDFGPGAPVLPVELVSFTATPTKSSVLLNWSTASEVNNDRFEVNRSTDGVSFTKVGEIVGNGTTNESSNYAFEDKEVLPGIENYYQLRQIDFDGSYDFSDVVSAKIEVAGFVVGEFVPNPTSNSTKIIVVSPYSAETEVTIYNVLGQVMYSKVQNIVDGQNIIELNNLSNFSKGNYLVNINTGIDQVTKKLTVIE